MNDATNRHGGGVRGADEQLVERAGSKRTRRRSHLTDAMPMDMEEDWYESPQGDTVEHDPEEDIRLPRKRRRQYMTFFTVITMVIATASCILVVLLMKEQSDTAAVNDARDQQVADQLAAIEASLGALDQSVTGAGGAAADTAASYAALGDTVDSLRSNLTDYRDNNDIQSEEIGEHLDRVITQLDKIKEDMSTQQEQEDQQDAALENRMDDLSKTSTAGASNLAEELRAVHEDIAALIDKAGDTQNGNYKELKGILTATDSSLSDLVADKFDETGELIATRMTRLQGSLDGVSASVNHGLSDVNTSVATGLAGVEDDLAGMQAGLTTIHENLASVSDGIRTVEDCSSSMEDSVEGLQESMDGLEDAAEALTERQRDTEELVLGRMDTQDASLLTIRQELSQDVLQITDQLTALQGTLDVRLKRMMAAMGLEESGEGTLPGGTTEPAGGDEKGTEGASGTENPEGDTGAAGEDGDALGDLTQ